MDAVATCTHRVLPICSSWKAPRELQLPPESLQNCCPGEQFRLQAMNDDEEDPQDLTFRKNGGKSR